MTTPPKKPAKSLLGRHRLLAPSASVWVSPICLGAMNFGTTWKHLLGECDKETSFKMLDFFYEQGGNFIDTAPNYQGEESETWLGEWFAKTGRRNEIVLATKFTGPWKVWSEPDRQQSNYGGNGAKNIHMCIEASLKKLQTSYIDLYYIHVWDFTTSIPELMQALNRLVLQGKVLYLGVSDTPAWIVVKCNEYARQHGLAQFSVYQGRWSAAERDFEREIIPMCKAEGMGFCPWGVLGGGHFKAKGTNEEGGRSKQFAYTDKDAQVSEVLEKIANRKGTNIMAVALAYILHKTPYVFPILGGRKTEHLAGNIEALGLEMTKEDMDEVEEAYPFNVGFPHNFLAGGNPKGVSVPQDCKFTDARAHFDWVQDGKPVRPHKE